MFNQTSMSVKITLFCMVILILIPCVTGACDPDRTGESRDVVLELPLGLGDSGGSTDTCDTLMSAYTASIALPRFKGINGTWLNMQHHGYTPRHKGIRVGKEYTVPDHIPLCHFNTFRNGLQPKGNGVRAVELLGLMRDGYKGIHDHQYNEYMTKSVDAPEDDSKFREEYIKKFGKLAVRRDQVHITTAEEAKDLEHIIAYCAEVKIVDMIIESLTSGLKILEGNTQTLDNYVAGLPAGTRVQKDVQEIYAGLKLKMDDDVALFGKFGLVEMLFNLLQLEKNTKNMMDDEDLNYEGAIKTREHITVDQRIMIKQDRGKKFGHYYVNHVNSYNLFKLFAKKLARDIIAGDNSILGEMCIPGVKGIERAFQKWVMKPDGLLKDLLRGTMICPTKEALQATILAVINLFRDGPFDHTVIMEVKNGWQPKPSRGKFKKGSYCDVKIIFKHNFKSNGRGGRGFDGTTTTYSEMIFMTKAMFEFKKGSHGSYDIIRQLSISDAFDHCLRHLERKPNQKELDEEAAKAEEAAWQADTAKFIELDSGDWDTEKPGSAKGSRRGSPKTRRSPKSRRSTGIVGNDVTASFIHARTGERRQGVLTR